MTIRERFHCRTPGSGFLGQAQAIRSRRSRQVQYSGTAHGGNRRYGGELRMTDTVVVMRCGDTGNSTADLATLLVAGRKTITRGYSGLIRIPSLSTSGRLPAQSHEDHR